jgi:exopolyphosphatase
VLRISFPDSSFITSLCSYVATKFSLDLDSLCSAVVFAYLRTYTPLSTSDTIHIPLSNLPRADLGLRPELRPVLTRAQLKLGDLITITDLQTSAQQTGLKPQNTRWILVDHNVLQGELGRAYSCRVIGTIDHHDDENKVPKDCGNEPRIITKSGSCTSLVIDYCKEAWDAATKQSEVDETAAWDTELAQLALAPILIDTHNLKDSSKTTSTDIKAVEYLESKIMASNDYSREEYFQQISSAKSDIGTLSSDDILRKDYKQWTDGDSVNLGMSSVVKDMHFLVDHAGGTNAFLDNIRQFATERKLSLYAIMTTSTTDGKFKRELLVYALNNKGVAAARVFDEDSADDLGLTGWERGELDSNGSGDKQEWRRCWVQSRVDASRKQVGPMLRKAINKTQT